VLELDPRIYEIAQSELGYVPRASIDVRVGDARQSIRGLPSDAFDIVVGDAFGGLAVPWHLTTREMLDQIDRVLRPRGQYVVNIIDYPPLRFVRAEAATAGSVFATVAVIARGSTIDGESGGNLVLVAGDTPLDTAAVEAAIAGRNEGAITRVLAERGDVDAFIGGSPILTDDFAPVDQLLGR
jgi:spermidine synthase